jgi:Na+-transporting NADH:ubiquinone oxidoreductase subunit NqrD
MALSWAVPFVVHLIPWNGEQPLGVHLLPAFWAAFVAVYLFGFWAGLLVALVTPAVNLIATGLPVMERMGSMSLEMVAYVAIAASVVRLWPDFRLTAPLAFLPAKAIAIVVRWAVPAFAYHRDPVAHWVDSISSGLAGLGVLLILNVALVSVASSDSDWDGD